MEFHNMQISDHRYFEKVCKNLRKKLNLAEEALVIWYRSFEDQRVDLRIIYVGNGESGHSSGTKLH